MPEADIAPAKAKRKAGISTGNAGEYFVMGELLRRGFDAQLADRNTPGYDILVGRTDEHALHKVQVKTVRSVPWYVSKADFAEAMLKQVTIYVLLGDEKAAPPVQYFLASNGEVAEMYTSHPDGQPEASCRLKP